MIRQIPRLCLMSALTILSSFCLFANDGGVECPPYRSDCPWGGTELVTFSNPMQNILLSVNVKKRICDGRIEISPDWSTIFKDGNGQYLTDKAIEELLLFQILESLSEDPAVPTCSGSSNPCLVSIEVAITSKSKCLRTSTCVYEVKTNSTEVCCNQDYGDRPTFLQDGKEFIKFTRTKECGSKCCQLVFKICRYYDFLHRVWHTNKCSIPSEGISYPSSVCSGSDGEPDCQTGAAQPCGSDCKTK